MSVREYYRLVAGLPTDWLRRVLAEAPDTMRPIHLSVVRLVLKRRGAVPHQENTP